MSEEYKYVRKVENGEEIFEPAEESSRKSVNAAIWKTRLVFWALVIGGIAVGTVFFLFFLTVFIYVIVPVIVIWLLWQAIQQWVKPNH